MMEPLLNISALNISTKCQRNCERCYGHLNHFRDHEFMKLQTAQKGTELILSHIAPEVGCDILLYGGEPLLNWTLIREFIPWFNIVNKYDKIKLHTCTNGISLTKEIIDFHYDNNINIAISLDGNYSFNSKKVTREEFDRIISLIEYGVKKNPNLFTPHCVLSNKNVTFMHDILSFLVSLGVKWINLERDLRETWSHEDRAELIMQMKSIILKYDVIFQPISESIFDCTSCCTKSMMIYPNGDVYDSCLCMASVLVDKGIISHDDTEVLYMGNVNSKVDLKIDEVKKRKLIRSHMDCHLIDQNLSHCLDQIYQNGTSKRPNFRIERLSELNKKRDTTSILKNSFSFIKKKK